MPPANRLLVIRFVWSVRTATPKTELSEQAQVSANGSTNSVSGKKLIDKEIATWLLS
jgi:hypothetical protein